MTIPAGVAVVTLTGSVGGGGADAAGSIEFAPSVPVAYAGPDWVNSLAPFNVTLVAGRFSIVLPATDDAAGRPTSWTYRVSERFGGARAAFNIELLSTAGAAQDYSSVIPVAVPGGYTSLAKGDPGPAGPAGPAGGLTDVALTAALQTGTAKAYQNSTYALKGAVGGATGNLIGTLVVAGCKTPTGGAGNATAPGITFRASYKTAVACTDLRIYLPGWYESGPHVETGLGATSTYKASIEYNGVTYPLSFGPFRSVPVDPFGMAVSDPIGLNLPKGAIFAVRTLISSVGSSGYPQGCPGGGNSTFTNIGNDGYTTGDVVDSVASATQGGLNSLWGPLAITGRLLQAPVPQLAVIGDSITDGTGDGIWGASMYGGSSWATRAVHDDIPMIRVTSPGTSASKWTGQKGTRRLAAMTGCTHAILALAHNDNYGNGAATLSIISADVLSLATLMSAAGMKVMVPTMTTRSTSTDGWLTPGNQAFVTAGTQNNKVAWNTWLRAGAPIDPTTKTNVAIGTPGALLTGQAGHPFALYNGGFVIELADAVESSRDSGFFKGAARTVTDAAMTAASGVLTSAAAAFTAADKGEEVSIQGAGAAGAALVTYIATVTNATTVSLQASAGTTVSGATAGIGIYTVDGTHPSQGGHMAMAAAFDITKLTL